MIVKSLKSSKINPIYIFAFIIISGFLLLNSNNIINKSIKEQFLPQIILRALGSKDFQEGTNDVCNKGTEELKEYYETGDLSSLGIKDNNSSISTDIDNEEHIKALIDIVRGATGEQTAEDTTENLKIYGKHLIVPLIFMFAGVLAIPGWIICCSCCSCNCCCCCCCTNIVCKIPFFIVTYACYIAVLCVSIYGLSIYDPVFTGLADTECSILKFFNETLEGETREELPKWAGINEIENILTNTVTQLDNLPIEMGTTLNSNKQLIEDKRRDFEAIMDGNSDSIDPSGTGKYGNFDKNTQKAVPVGSYMDLWYKEYSVFASNSKTFLNQAQGNFQNLISDNTLSSSLNQGKSVIGDIGNSISNIKDGVADIIIDYSDVIDDYGKLGFKVLFSVLAAIDGATAGLMLLLCLTSGKFCNKCCLCRCIFKLGLHLLWNIMALFMVITLISGSLITSLGTAGSDLTTSINYFISPDNLNLSDPSKKPMLFGDVGTKLNKCFNDDGDITSDIGISIGGTSSFNNLSQIVQNIETIENSFNSIKDDKPAYKKMMDDYDTNKDTDPLYDTNFKDRTNEIEVSYDAYLNSEITGLRSFKNKIRNFTDEFTRYTGNSTNIFSLINCRFIGKNIQVILKNIDKSLGNDIYNIGVCFIAMGCCLAVSIIFTIFLIIIINKSVEENKKE